MWLAAAGLLMGFMLMVWSADLFMDGAVKLARRLQISPLIIGLTFVAFGTSAPEIIVCIMAAIDGQSEIAVGNVIGSNIANITLVLSITLLACPIFISPKAIRPEVMILLATTCCLCALLLDGVLDRTDGLILLLGFALFVWHLWRQLPKHTERGKTASVVEQGFQQHFWLVGAVVLPLSAEIIITSAVSMATIVGIDEFIIGVTIVAIGTSLPEIATTLAAAHKKSYDLVLGNLIGSNIFNILIVLPFPVLLEPGTLSGLSPKRDLGMLIFTTLMLGGMACFRSSTIKLGRGTGLLLITSYGFYLTILLASKF